MKEHYKAILFDLDGTLLPMDMKTFTEGYFRDLYKTVNMPEIPVESFIDAIWKGTYAMMKNDGAKTNRDVFWDTFAKILDYDEDMVNAIDAKCLAFYGNEFKNAKRFCMENPLAKVAVEVAREKADVVVLATNAIFPLVGQITRLGWIDLKEEDFDLITCYEKEYFCKPNPKYFGSIMEKMGLKPEECLMIGNDEREDMLCASMAGIDSYLVEDTMIPYSEKPWEGEKGSFADMIDKLKALK